MTHTYAVSVPLTLLFVIEADNPDIACAYAMTYANLAPSQIPRDCVEVKIGQDCAEITEIANGD